MNASRQRWSAAGLVAMGLLALVLGGGVEGLAAAVAVPFCAAASGLRRWTLRLPWWWLGAGATGLLLVRRVFGGGSTQEAVGMGLVYLLLSLRLGREGAAADRLSALMTILMMVGTAARTLSPLYLPIWFGWALFLPGAVWSPAVDAEAALVWRARRALSAAVVVLAVALFLVLPRRAPARVPQDGVVGFSDEVVLGEFEHLLDDDTQVATIRFQPDYAGEVRLRGMALGDFDGRRWSHRASRRSPRFLDPSVATHTVEVEHDVLGDDLLLLPGPPASLNGPAIALYADDADAFRAQVAGDVVRYTADVRMDAPWGRPRLGVADTRAYLQLPPLDPRIAALAHGLVGDLTEPKEKVRVLVRHLEENFTYTRTDVTAGDAPLATFLFDRRTGHCEYFAASLATMSRVVGVPSRVVNGFVGGEKSDEGVIMRRSDAHAWVEVHLPGYGWTPVDPTAAGAPGAWAELGPLAFGPRIDLRAGARRLWFEGVVGFDGHTQRDGVLWTASWVGGGWRMFGLVSLMGLGAAGLAWWRRPGRRAARRVARPARDGIAGLVDGAHRRLAKEGWSVPPGLPPLDAARWVADRSGPEGQALVRLTWLYYEVVHGAADEGSRRGEADLLAELVARIGAPREL